MYGNTEISAPENQVWKRRKILMVIDSLDKGGKERRLLELVKGLLKRPEGYEICLVSLTNRVEYTYVYDMPIRFIILERRFKKDPGIIFQIRKILRSFKPDIIHSWSTMASTYLALANNFPKRPLINAVLADAHPGLTLKDKHFFRVKLTTPFTNVFVSNSLAGIKAYRTPEKKSVCIYNGIDFNRFKNLPDPEKVRDSIWQENKPKGLVFIMVARFDERKDFATLVKTAIKLCETRSDINFLLVGDGPTLAPIKSMIPADLANHRILCLGKREDVESILQIAHVGILMTNHQNHGEGVSNSIIEYMAAGLPVIATRGGGTDEVLVEGKNGWLIDPGDPLALSACIENILDNSTQLNEMKEFAANWAQKNFDLNQKTEEYIKLYESIINGLIYR